MTKMRELLDRISLANLIVGVIAAVIVVLIVGAGFDFDANEMLEVLVTGALVTVALGAFALLAHIVGLILEMVEPDVDAE